MPLFFQHLEGFNLVISDRLGPALTPVSSMIHFMLLSDFAIPMKGKLDDVDSAVLGRLVLNVSVC